MTDPRRDRLPFAALGFGVAAALSSWNPLSAPFGVLVGLAALLLAVRALGRAEGRRAVPIAAVLVSAAAVVASAVVLALTAGVGRELRGAPVVASPRREEVSAELERAAERTKAARERARAELEKLEPSSPDRSEKAPRGEGKPATEPAPPRDARARTR